MASWSHMGWLDRYIVIPTFKQLSSFQPFAKLSICSRPPLQRYFPRSLLISLFTFTCFTRATLHFPLLTYDFWNIAATVLFLEFHFSFFFSLFLFSFPISLLRFTISLLCFTISLLCFTISLFPVSLFLFSVSLFLFSVSLFLFSVSLGFSWATYSSGRLKEKYFGLGPKMNSWGENFVREGEVEVKYFTFHLLLVPVFDFGLHCFSQFHRSLKSWFLLSFCRLCCRCRGNETEKIGLEANSSPAEVLLTQLWTSLWIDSQFMFTVFNVSDADLWRGL